MDWSANSDGNYWFGYCEKLQFEPTDRRILGMEVGFEGDPHFLLRDYQVSVWSVWDQMRIDPLIKRSETIFIFTARASK